MRTTGDRVHWCLGEQIFSGVSVLTINSAREVKSKFPSGFAMSEWRNCRKRSPVSYVNATRGTSRLYSDCREVN